MASQRWRWTRGFACCGLYHHRRHACGHLLRVPLGISGASGGEETAASTAGSPRTGSVPLRFPLVTAKAGAASDHHRGNRRHPLSLPSGSPVGSRDLPEAKLIVCHNPVDRAYSPVARASAGVRRLSEGGAEDASARAGRSDPTEQGVPLVDRGIYVGSSGYEPSSRAMLVIKSGPVREDAGNIRRGPPVPGSQPVEAAVRRSSSRWRVPQRCEAAGL
jgi:hypothetical protein